ncbi:extracellular solute-binding protein [Corynebacterium mendelii]|uniref:extracellular solute-binding protein n=1 Tax=Corynebacterium mendelii TaxID=2765362 RepID=UPI002ED5ECCB
MTWFNFALNDQLAPIGDLLEKVGGDPADYISNFYDEYTLDGNHYAVPYSRSTPLFYYNKDMWAKAGLPERGPKDWDEWNDEFAPKLKQTLDAGVSPLVIPDGTNYMDWYFQGMIWSLGGAYSNEWTMAMGDDDSVKAGQFLKSQFEQGYFKAAKDATAPFLAGQTAAILESTGSLGGLTKADKINFGTAFLPSPEGVEGCPTGGAGLAVPAKSKNQEAAAKFVAFATNTANTNYFSENTGYMPVRTSAIELPEVQKRMQEDPNYSTAIEQLPHTKKQDAGRVFVPGGGMRIGAGLDKIAQGATVEEVFGGIDAEQQKLIDSEITPKLK